MTQFLCHCGCLVSSGEMPCDAPFCVLASAIEAEGGNEVPSRSDESAVSEAETPNPTPPKASQ